MLSSLEQTRPPLAGGQRRPAGKCRLSGSDRRVGVFQGRRRHPRNHFASHQVTAFKSTSVTGRARLTADQQGHVQHGDSSLYCYLRAALSFKLQASS
ncbi:Pullulanase/glycogen debranching enzyme [Pseudomonas syringae pv. actinidiae]|uniref:Pullulanase/glycogen debranching enzyme n=1 Tax=Pseudomonas syringae pv. actinidiae TaxID=103796 RepID=A0AAN4Q6Q0_PSESF|nr:Pullulanase/glycogen debranching enzyme [Pseudomonas syringae pv. actinidiae]